MLTVQQAIKNPAQDFLKKSFILSANDVLKEFLEAIGLHPMDLGVPPGFSSWSNLQEETFYRRLETGMLPYEGERAYSFDELKKIYLEVSRQANIEIASFQIFIKDEDTEWSLGGCWGSETAAFEFLDDAKEAADFLSKQYNGAKFGVFMMDRDEREKIPSYEAWEEGEK